MAHTHTHKQKTQTWRLPHTRTWRHSHAHTHTWTPVSTCAVGAVLLVSGMGLLSTHSLVGICTKIYQMHACLFEMETWIRMDRNSFLSLCVGGCGYVGVWVCGWVGALTRRYRSRLHSCLVSHRTCMGCGPVSTRRQRTQSKSSQHLKT